MTWARPDRADRIQQLLHRRAVDRLVPIAACTCDHPARIGCHRCGPQPREHATSCGLCGRATWAWAGVCPACEDLAAAADDATRTPHDWQQEAGL